MLGWLVPVGGSFGALGEAQMSKREQKVNVF